MVINLVNIGTVGKDGALRRKLEELQPDIIHTVGVFPDYAVSQIAKYKQIHTLRNYVYDDYPAKFGKVKGTILAKMQLSAMKKSEKTIACSESLTKIYKEKLHQSYDFIRNGVDIEQYTMPTVEQKKSIRKELGLPKDAFIWVYTGQFIERKNIPFLLEHYNEKFGNDERSYMLLLGGGPELKALSERYADKTKLKIKKIPIEVKSATVYTFSTLFSRGLAIISMMLFFPVFTK